MGDSELVLLLLVIVGCFMSGFKVVTLKEIPIGKRSPISKFYYSIPSCQRKSTKFSGDIILSTYHPMEKKITSYCTILNVPSFEHIDFFADRTLNVMFTVPNLIF